MKFDFFIRSEEDLIEAVRIFGFVPLFKNSVPGFSVAEHVSPDVWFPENGEGVWEWKGPVIRRTGCAYGKFFEHKAVFISPEWFPDFANFRRDGYDFDSRCEEGLAPYADKLLFELADANAPIDSRKLKRLGGYGKSGRGGFDAAMNRLQAQCYLIISDFIYMLDRYGRPYGWGVAEYSTPEKHMGQEFMERVYRTRPEESSEKITDHLRSLLPDIDMKHIENLMKR